MNRILLVEDEPDVRVLLEHVLWDAGYDADAVETAAEAEALLGSRRYDLVVADALLADGTGLEIADDAKERGTPSLVITGYAVQLAGELERYDYLLKPLKPAEFVHAIQARLGRSDPQR